MLPHNQSTHCVLNCVKSHNRYTWSRKQFPLLSQPVARPIAHLCAIAVHATHSNDSSFAAFANRPTWSRKPANIPCRQAIFDNATYAIGPPGVETTPQTGTPGVETPPRQVHLESKPHRKQVHLESKPVARAPKQVHLESKPHPIFPPHINHFQPTPSRKRRNGETDLSFSTHLSPPPLSLHHPHTPPLTRRRKAAFGGNERQRSFRSSL
jgi:hypothetical protein